MSGLLNSFGGRSLDRFVFDYEVPDGGGVPDGAPAEPVPDGGGVAAPEPGSGAAAGADGAVTPPAVTPTIDWDAPEVADRITAVVEQREQARAAQAAEAERQAEAAQTQQGRFSAIEEGLALLGIDANEFKAYLGDINAPFAQVAERVQKEESLKQINSMLDGLGSEHPDLLGADIAKLAEFTNDDGSPRFDLEEVGVANRNAVLFAASALDQAARREGKAFPEQTLLAQAASHVSVRDKLIGDIAVQRYRRDLGASGNAPHVVGDGGSGGRDNSTGLEGGDELSVARRFNQERAAQR